MPILFLETDFRGKVTCCTETLVMWIGQHFRHGENAARLERLEDFGEGNLSIWNLTQYRDQ